MMRKTLIAFSIVAALGAGAAFAAPQDADAPASPAKKLDVNGDGKIDRKEAAASPGLARQFDALDKDKDGFLSREERPRPAHGDRRHGRGHGGLGDGDLARLDTNHDGRISAEEARAGEAARFARLDVNKDGYIDKADRVLLRKQRFDAWFARADTNKDGQLSKAELEAANADHAWRGRDGRDGKPGPDDRRGPGAAPTADAQAPVAQ